MGDFNSSVTRVWPVFDCMFQQDSTGMAWLPSLLKLGSRAGRVRQQIHSNPGPLLPELARIDLALPGPVKKAIGPERSTRIERIRNAYEAEIPPSSAFLRWMLEHPHQLTWPKGRKGIDLVFSRSTQRSRKHFLDGDPQTRDEALAQLSRLGAIGSRRKWWAFEGFTSVDCRLETESLLLLIEGKRTEPISNSTNWFPGRNQVIRNLEVAQALAGDQKNFAVLLCAETPVELPDDAWRRSLPHFSPIEIQDLKSHYLGCTTWSTIIERLCNGLELPKTVDEAIALCLRLRS